MQLTKHGDPLVKKPKQKIFGESPQIDELWFVNLHGYWEGHCNFEIRMPTNHLLIKVFVGWHNLDEFAIPPRDDPTLLVQLLSWYIKWEPSRLLLVWSLSLLVFFVILKVRGSKANRTVV